MNWLTRLISARVRELEGELHDDKIYAKTLIERDKQNTILIERLHKDLDDARNSLSEVCDTLRDKQKMLDRAIANKFHEMTPSPFAETVAEITKPKPKGDLIWRKDVHRSITDTLAPDYPMIFTHYMLTKIRDAIDSVPAAESHEVHRIAPDLGVSSSFKQWAETDRLIADLREQIRVKEEEAKEFKEYSKTLAKQLDDKDERIAELESQLHPSESDHHDVEEYYRETKQTDDYAAAYRALLTAKEQGQKQHAAEIKVMEEASEALTKANERIAELEKLIDKNADSAYAQFATKDARIADLEEQLHAREQALKDALKKEPS